MTIFRGTAGDAAETALFDTIAGAVAEPGYGVFPDSIEPDFCAECMGWLETRIAEGGLVRSGVGRGTALEVRPEIRSDSIYWLEPDEPDPAVTAWLAAMDRVRDHLRRQLLLPLESYEGHLARYPAQGFYKAHLDQHRASPTRQITLIFYLNNDWTEADGGLLRLYTDPQRGTEGDYLDVVPRKGTVVAFRSADFWHEVLPAGRPRVSLTGWFRGREINPLMIS